MDKQSQSRLLKKVRSYTGDFFTPARGYDGRKPLNFGRRMALLKYANKIDDLTAKPFIEYTPKKGEKNEAFKYTGQKGFRAFTKALIYHPAPNHNLKFEIDKTLPTGSRFTVLDYGPKDKPRTMPTRYYNIPGHYFIDAFDDYSDPYEFEGMVGDILEEHAPGAELFLIQAGDSYMFGAGQGRHNLASKLLELMTNYSSSVFDPTNKNSSYYGNWLKGVMAFTSRHDALDAMRDGIKKRDARLRTFIRPDQEARMRQEGLWGIKYRTLKDGRIVGMREGAIVVPPFYPQAVESAPVVKRSKRDRLKGR